MLIGGRTDRRRGHRAGRPRLTTSGHTGGAAAHPGPPPIPIATVVTLALVQVFGLGCVVGRADVYLQPDAPDPVLPARVVLGLARRHVPDAAAVAGVDESGGEARAYLIDDGVVVKTQRPHRLRPRTSLAKEAYLLDALAPALVARIPRLLGYDRIDTAAGTVEYLCMTRIPGLPVRSAAIAPRPGRGCWPMSAALAADPARRRRRPIRSCPPTPTPLPLYRRLEFGFADHPPMLSASGPARWTLPLPAAEIAARALAALPASAGAPTVVLHSNPSPTHVFVDPAHSTMTGVIDFGDAYTSHPALDLHRWPAPADRVAIRDAYLDGMAPIGRVSIRCGRSR